MLSSLCENTAPRYQDVNVIGSKLTLSKLSAIIEEFRSNARAILSAKTRGLGPNSDLLLFTEQGFSCSVQFGHTRLVQMRRSTFPTLGADS
jgi:hypothetical protein